MEAEQKREQAEKQLAEKNSELIREKGEFLLKSNADSETIKRQQKELNGLRKYMETAERHWDLLAENILGSSLRLTEDMPQLVVEEEPHLRSAQTGQEMDILPELVTDLQASSARGAAAMTLTMCLAHNPEMDLDRVTTGVPPTADVGALLDAVSGYDTRIARRIRHKEFYDKVVLPATSLLKPNFKKSATRKPDLRNPELVYLDQLQGCSPRGTQVQRCNFRRRRRERGRCIVSG
ncbi:hypothetical protein QYE76_071553 [Lolium multiflorum]|uniref:Uncharacterized protein n=1 Tax=Lolium multiflorum TaxID=4521 RepID=A0AAD8WEZ7_LOLMU|nr:hypothetical protein QYE76_071553 [Lolium multiflorum]